MAGTLEKISHFSVRLSLPFFPSRSVLARSLDFGSSDGKNVLSHSFIFQFNFASHDLMSIGLMQHVGELFSLARARDR